MAVLPLVQLERKDFEQKNIPLRKPSGSVTDFGREFQEIVDDLVDTLKHHKVAIGLAAPQVGIQFQLAVINLNKNKIEPTLIVVNPRILGVSGKKDQKNESCMSLPHFAGRVERHEKLTLTFQDRFGESKTLTAQGFLARVLAHEIDHLEGKLYIDRMTSLTALQPTDLFKND